MFHGIRRSNLVALSKSHRNLLAAPKSNSSICGRCLLLHPSSTKAEAFGTNLAVRSLIDENKVEGRKNNQYRKFVATASLFFSAQPDAAVTTSIINSVNDNSNNDNNNGEATTTKADDATTEAFEDNIDVEEVRSILNELKKVEKWSNVSQDPNPLDDVKFCDALSLKFGQVLEHLCQLRDRGKLVHAESLDQARELLSADNVAVAIRVLRSSQHEPKTLSIIVRQWEKDLGKLKWTPLTDELSLELLMANGNAGNVGRVLALLGLRKSRDYPASDKEFIHAIQSLKTASLSQHMGGIRNIYIHDSNQPAVDNPTRWLDAILLNMADRKFRLTTTLANSMIDCYSAAGGRTGKAVHFFYRVVRQGILTMSPEEKPLHTDDMPKQWFYVPESGRNLYQPVKVKVKYNEGTPPFYKVPATVKGKLLYRKDSTIGKLKLEQELEPEYSVPLAAAFAFADSLQHGACGHDPIELDVGSYNGLIKASVVRGALWRAIQVLDSTMPSAGIKPNAKSFNLVLSGLAVVGDVVTAQEYYLKMYHSGIQPDAFTVDAVVDGLLNMNDIPGAVTAVQDFFNQHNVLPHLSKHNKILELCLGQGMVYEAKRYIFFIQQLWKWEPNKYHDEEFVKLMRTTQQQPNLQKVALKKLFAYFGEELKDSDFLP